MASNSQYSKVMEQNLELINTMARSDAINKLESHQKKSLKQIRNIMMEVVTKSKMRSKSIGMHY